MIKKLLSILSTVAMLWRHRRTSAAPVTERSSRRCDEDEQAPSVDLGNYSGGA